MREECHRERGGCRGCHPAGVQGALLVGMEPGLWLGPQVPSSGWRRVCPGWSRAERTHCLPATGPGAQNSKLGPCSSVGKAEFSSHVGTRLEECGAHCCVRRRQGFGSAPTAWWTKDWGPIRPRSWGWFPSRWPEPYLCFFFFYKWISCVLWRKTDTKDTTTEPKARTVGVMLCRRPWADGAVELQSAAGAGVDAGSGAWVCSRGAGLLSALVESETSAPSSVSGQPSEQGGWDPVSGSEGSEQASQGRWGAWRVQPEEEARGSSRPGSMHTRPETQTTIRVTRSLRTGLDQ